MQQAHSVAMPALNPADFDSEEEYLYHLSICQTLARSWNESQQPGAVFYTLEKVMARFDSKEGA